MCVCVRVRVCMCLLVKRVVGQRGAEVCKKGVDSTRDGKKYDICAAIP